MYLKLSEVTAVDIELTNKCNAACPACNRQFYDPKSLNNFEYSLQHIKDIVPKELLRPDVEFFFGGTVDDAMMNSQVVEICDYLLSGGSDIVLETNTGANTAATFTALGELSNKHDHRLLVRFSVDGTEKSNHLYRVNVKWKTVLRNMTAYAKTGGKCSWQYLVFDHNYNDIEEAYAISKQLKIPFELRQGTRDTQPYLSLITEKNKDTKKIEKKEVMVEHSKKFEHDHIKERQKIKEEKEYNPRNINCYMIHKKQIFIDSTGKLWPCCYYASENVVPGANQFYKDLQKQYGRDWNNVFKHSVEEIINHEYYKDVLYKTFVDENYSHMFNNMCQLECGDGGYRSQTKRVKLEDK